MVLTPPNFCDSHAVNFSNLVSLANLARVDQILLYLKISFFVHKMTQLKNLPDLPSFAKQFNRTCQTCQYSPKAIFDKNVTRLAKFARVMSESRDFDTSVQCLIKIQQKITKNIASDTKTTAKMFFIIKLQAVLKKFCKN